MELIGMFTAFVVVVGVTTSLAVKLTTVYLRTQEAHAGELTILHRRIDDLCVEVDKKEELLYRHIDHVYTDLHKEIGQDVNA